MFVIGCGECETSVATRIERLEEGVDQTLDLTDLLSIVTRFGNSIKFI